jgi:hypothetical protein
MYQVLNVSREGNLFIMEVELQGGYKEKWTYSREEADGLVSFSMIDREEA